MSETPEQFCESLGSLNEQDAIRAIADRDAVTFAAALRLVETELLGMIHQEKARISGRLTPARELSAEELQGYSSPTSVAWQNAIAVIKLLRADELLAAMSPEGKQP